VSRGAPGRDKFRVRLRRLGIEGQNPAYEVLLEKQIDLRRERTFSPGKQNSQAEADLRFRDDGRVKIGGGRFLTVRTTSRDGSRRINSEMTLVCQE